MKRMVTITSFILLLIANMSMGQNAVTIDSISGFMSPNKLPVGQPVAFPIHFVWHTNPGDGMGHFSVGFDLFSPDGATWVPTTHAWATNPAATALRTDFGYSNFFINKSNWNGNNHDTVSLNALDNNEQFGQLETFDGTVALFTTAGFPLADTGKTFCMDSCTLHGIGADWAFGGGITFGVYLPTWGTGPYAANYTPGVGYCFTLATPPYVCGDINASDTVTVADMVYLVQYFFNSGPAIPNPPMRANVNCLGDPARPNIADNTYLVSYLFNNGPAPCANCP